MQEVPNNNDTRRQPKQQCKKIKQLKKSQLTKSKSFNLLTYNTKKIKIV